MNVMTGSVVRRGIVTLVICSAAGMLAACSSESEVETPTDVDPVEWVACEEFPDDDTVECATVRVPLDYRNPNKETIDIALIRYPAYSGKVKGVLIVNPGGPGESGFDFAYDSGPEMIDSLGLEDFDIVGFDPRGVDRSGGLKCQSDRDIDRYVYLDYTPDSDTEEAVYDEWLELDDPCVAKYGDELRHFSTENAARDIDQIRRAMGVEKIHYLGISWGTYLGGVYATLFPESVHTMFLDAGYDPQDDSPEDMELTQAVGFEESFDSWVKWCEGDEEKCAFNSLDVKSDWLELETTLDADPIRADDGRDVNAAVLDIATISVLYTEADWPLLGDALANAAQGDGAALLDLADYWVGRDKDGTFSSSYDAFGIIECASGTSAYEPDEPEALFERLRREAPWFSRNYTVDDMGLSCDETYGDPEIFEVKVESSIPIVVLGGANDPATPMRWSEELVGRLGDTARLAVFNGEGHAHILSSRCVDELASSLFTSKRLPANGYICEPDVLFEKPEWWDEVVDIKYPRVDDVSMDWYFSTERTDMYAEYFAVPGNASEVFALIRAHFESRGWVYEEWGSTDPVEEPQFFADFEDDTRFVGVWLSSPDELRENEISGPDGVVAFDTSVAMVYYYP